MIVELIAGLMGAGMAYTMHETNQAMKYSEKAIRKREDAVELERDSYRKIERAEESAENSMKKLFNIKKGIYSTSIPKLVSTFEPISTLSFLDNLSGLDTGEAIQVQDSLSTISEMTTVYSEAMTSQQQMMAVLMGPCGIMHAEKKNQEKELAYASKQMNMARVMENYSNNKILLFDTIKEKNEMLWDLLRKLNVLLVSSLEESKKSIDIHGKNEMEYTDTEIDNLRFTLQLADVITKLCSSSLFTDGGEFISESAVLIQKGNEIISEANCKIQTRR